MSHVRAFLNLVSKYSLCMYVCMYVCGEARRCPLASEPISRISYVKRSGNMILDPHPESDQHQNLTTSIEGYPLPVKFGPHPLTRS